MTDTDRKAAAGDGDPFTPPLSWYGVPGPAVAGGRSGCGPMCSRRRWVRTECGWCSGRWMTRTRRSAAT